MKEKKFSWTSYHIDMFEKNVAQHLADDLDPEEDADEIEELNNAQTILSTDIGLIVKDDSMSSLRTIEHWLCDTNFDIDTRVVALVNSIEGVETLTVTTRYKMIVGFGKLFDVRGVKDEIESTLRNIDEIPKEKMYRIVRKTLKETFLGRG